MSRYLGIDLGTTTIAAVVLDTDSSQMVARHSVPNDSRLPINEPSGRSEWDIDRMVELALEAIAARTGLPAGLPVANGCGDNQASFAGSVADFCRSVLVNIGTGAQISAFTEQPLLAQGLDLRPALGGGFLLVGATLCGGHSYQILRDFFYQVGRDIFGLADMPDMYDALNQLATEVPPGAEGLRCEPLFAGSRQ